MAPRTSSSSEAASSSGGGDASSSETGGAEVAAQQQQQRQQQQQKQQEEAQRQAEAKAKQVADAKAKVTAGAAAAAAAAKATAAAAAAAAATAAKPAAAPAPPPPAAALQKDKPVAAAASSTPAKGDKQQQQQQPAKAAAAAAPAKAAAAAPAKAAAVAAPAADNDNDNDDDDDDDATTVLYTEPGVPDDRDERYGAYRLRDDPAAVARYRRWWRRQPLLSGPWPPGSKPSLWRRFRKLQERGADAAEADDPTAAVEGAEPRLLLVRDVATLGNVPSLGRALASAAAEKRRAEGLPALPPLPPPPLNIFTYGTRATGTGKLELPSAEEDEARAQADAEEARRDLELLGAGAGGDDRAAAAAAAALRAERRAERRARLDAEDRAWHEMVEVLESVPSDEQDEAWFGVPDPRIYKSSSGNKNKRGAAAAAAQPSLALTPEQIREEQAKGNIVTLRQLKRALAEAGEEELDEARAEARRHYYESEVYASVPAAVAGSGGGGGSSGSATAAAADAVQEAPPLRVSLWDAYDLVHRNPELAALAARGDPNMFRVDGAAAAAPPAGGGGGGGGRGGDDPASRPWSLLATGDLWSRPPSRWLKGLDGVRDAHVGVYAHEAVLRGLLAPRWARRRPGAVLGGGGGGGDGHEFARDLVAHGPAAGLTVVLAIARPLPLDAAVATWTARLRAVARAESGLEPSAWPPAAATLAAAAAGRVPRPLLSQEQERKDEEGEGGGEQQQLLRLRVDELAEAEEALAGLGAILSREALAAPRTRLLLDTRARGGAASASAALREGSRVLLTAAPGGALLVQAVAPPLRDGAPLLGADPRDAKPEGYLLGSVRSPLLCRALCAAASDPRRAVDAPLARRALSSALLYANGVTSADVLERRRRGSPDGALPPVALPPRGAGALWRLHHEAGAGVGGGGGVPPPPLLLRGVRAAIVRAKADAAAAAAAAARGGAAAANVSRPSVAAAPAAM